MAGEDLDERLPLRVVLRDGQLLVEPGPGRRVETPRRAVRDDDRVEPPLRELLVELLRRLGRLVAIGGQRAGVDARRAERHVAQLQLELLEVEVALAVRPVVQRELDALPEGSHHAHRADQLAVERADRTRRHTVVVRVAEDDVLVPVVVGRRRPHLRPLPAEEGDEVGVVRVARHRVALPDGLLGLRPVARRDRLRVVVDAPEVEARAEAGEVAGIRGRMDALALEHRQARDEGIGREGGVHVQVAEEDLLGRCRPGCEGGHGARRVRRPASDDRRRHAGTRRLAGSLVLAAAARHDGGGQERSEREASRHWSSSPRTPDRAGRLW